MPVSEWNISEAVLEQAADYYLGLQDGTISGSELHEWQEWLQADEGHRRAFSRLEALWGVLELASKSEVQKLSASSADIKPASPKPAAGGSVLSMVSPSATTRKAPRFTMAWTGAMAASVAAALLAVYVLLAGNENHVPQPATQTYETAASEHRVVKLADGSIVEMNAGSAISVTYTANERRLTLDEGQAIFTVAKNPKRPFVVRAGMGSVTAIGTVFNVRKTEGDVEVHVLEGTVAVRPVADTQSGGEAETSSPISLVTAGKQTSYSLSGLSIEPVIPASAVTDLGWRVGVLTMVDLPIRDVIAELNRYLASEIKIGDEAVGRLRFTGTVYPDQVQAWLEGLQEGYPIEVVRLEGNTILMMADESSDTVVR
jgi:transmembrane sensor